MALSGKIDTLKITSNLLKDNPLGDPFERDCPVYVPPGYNSQHHYPLLVDLAPYTSSGLARIAWKNFSKNIPERIDDMIVAGEMPPVLVAFPDCFTKLGGNQYINSAAMGPYEDHIMQEIVPLVENTYTCGGAGKRGVYGKSSGGYAALIYGMKHPDFWRAIACQSGDMEFELAYLYEMPDALVTFAQYDHCPQKFLTAFEQNDTPTGADIHLLMMMAMAATYDPSPDPKDYLGIRFPVDLHTLEIIPERWKNWLRHDPFEMLDRYSDNLKKLKGLFIDCGAQDQYRFQYAARKFSKALKNKDIPHIYEEFQGTHFATDHRLEQSLPFLLKALS